MNFFVQHFYSYDMYHLYVGLGLISHPLRVVPMIRSTSWYSVVDDWAVSLAGEPQCTAQLDSPSFISFPRKILVRFIFPLPLVFRRFRPSPSLNLLFMDKAEIIFDSATNLVKKQEDLSANYTGLFQ